MKHIHYPGRAVATTPEQRRAIECNNTAVTQWQAGHHAAALEALDEAMRLDPREPAYASNTGAFLAGMKRYVASLPYLLRAAEIDLGYLPVHENLCVSFGSMGELDGALRACENGLVIKPDDRYLLEGLIFYADYHPDTTPEEAAQLRHEYQRRHIDTVPRFTQYANDRTPDRQLRVGYVSGDFCNHSAAGTFLAFIEGHTSAVHTIAYSSTPADRLASGQTARFKRIVKDWRDIRHLHDDDAARLIREDRIDILVDLSGYSRDNRLPIFGRRPAPVQIHGWGCMVGTTALSCFDAIMTDDDVVAPATIPLYTEEIVRLPCCIAFAPPSDDYEVVDSPALRSGSVTFGALHRLIKMTPGTIALWCRVLAAVPASRLLVKVTSVLEVEVIERLQQELRGEGIDPTRVDIQAQTTRSEHLRRHADIDIMLDSTPHGGGVSAAESLWMGVPIVTLVGETVVSRLTYSFLRAIGMEAEWATWSPEAYVERAVHWATHLDELNAVRRFLRGRMRASRMLDHRGYVRAVEQAYRAAWRDWLDSTGATR